jgi:predicted secreted protein
MPRFVVPTGEEGFVVTLDNPGKHNIFYENLGAFEGKAFNTPRRQIWTTFAAPSMTCTVTRIDTGEAVEVRLPGQSDTESKSKTSKDQVVAYDLADMQGHSTWVFDVDKPGEYRVVLSYAEAVYLEPGDIEIPPELTKAEKKKMVSEEGAAYEAARRDAVERAALAELEPIDVLFAVGPDPTVGSFFNVIGLKGAATVLAFGFTFAVLTSLVTLMLRSGHVTPRGEVEHVRRLGEPNE